MFFEMSSVFSVTVDGVKAMFCFGLPTPSRIPYVDVSWDAIEALPIVRANGFAEAEQLEAATTATAHKTYARNEVSHGYREGIVNSRNLTGLSTGLAVPRRVHI